jgi:hypothetical protein
MVVYAGVDHVGVPFGEGPDIIADAIKFVRSYGVDSMTETILEKSHANITKDPEKVKAFINAVYAVDQGLRISRCSPSGLFYPFK